MDQLTRYLLASSLLAALVPVAAVAAPDALQGSWLWSGAHSEASSPVLAMTSADAPEADAKQGTVMEANGVVCAPPSCSSSEEHQGTIGRTETSVTDGGMTSSTSAGETTVSTAAETPSTSDQSTSTTEASTTTATSEKTVSPTETITGSACPCTVTGTVKLQGRVSLQGDLLVKGGTLIARPGVDVEGNGFQIMFMNGGRADFQGTRVFTWSDRGSKVNLQRDINFRNMKRIVWMGGGPSVLKYFTVTDSGTPTLGDYPLHWHLNGDSTRGTIVEGVVVVNGAHHAFVPHGSHGITFKDVIAKNTSGDAFWWDPPGTNESCSFQKFCTLDNSNDIIYDHALVDGVRPQLGSNGTRVTGFQLGAGSGNLVRNSVAVNISGGKDCSGFHWPEHGNQNSGGNVWTFKNNVSKSSGCHGIFVWQNDGNRHVIDGFSGSGIDHGAYANTYDYRNVNVPYIEVHASGWRVVGGAVDTVVAKRHRNSGSPTVAMENLAVANFIVDNGSNGGDVPGVYVLNNTGLGCDDIEYRDVVTGTRIVIDGTEC